MNSTLKVLESKATIIAIVIATKRHSPRPPFFNRGSQRGGRSRGESLYLREKVPETAINYRLISHNYRPSQTSRMPERLCDSACRYAKKFLFAGPDAREKSWLSRRIVSTPNYDSRDNKRQRKLKRSLFLLSSSRSLRFGRMLLSVPLYIRVLSILSRRTLFVSLIWKAVKIVII